MLSKPAKLARRRNGAHRAWDAGRELDLSLAPGETGGVLIRDGRPTHVLIPLEEYERLVKSWLIDRAIAKIDAPDEDFVDADDFFAQLAAEKVVKARRAAGLTQKQLGAKLRLPQSQISRIERNPDHTTVRTIKRIAKALGVNVSALVG